MNFELAWLPFVLSRPPSLFQVVWSPKIYNVAVCPPPPKTLEPKRKNYADYELHIFSQILILKKKLQRKQGGFDHLHLKILYTITPMSAILEVK